MDIERTYSTRRLGIVDALAEKLKLINGTGDYLVDLAENVENKISFWDEVQEFPYVGLTAGRETRQYQGAAYKDRFLIVKIMCYVNEEDSIAVLDALLEDIEVVVEQNSRLAYKDKQGNSQYTQQISIISIDTDEGTLSPLGIGEIMCEVRY